MVKMNNKNTVSPRIDGEIPNVSKYIRTFSNINSFNQDHCMDNNKAENFTGWISEDPDAAVPFKKNGKWDAGIIK